MDARWFDRAVTRREALEVAELLMAKRVKRPALSKVVLAVGGLVGVKMQTFGGRDGSCEGGGVVVPFVWGFESCDNSDDDIFGVRCCLRERDRLQILIFDLWQ